MRTILTIAALIICLLAASIDTAQAIDAGYISYQGKLDSAGTAINGNRSIIFRLYTVPTGGGEIWEELAPAVPVSNGLFTHMLGSQLPIPDSVFNFNELWLEVEVEGQTIGTRSRLTAVAISKRVATVDSANGGTIKTKVSIGPGHTNTGTNAFVAGENNTASGDYSAVPGGLLNSATGSFATVGGGVNNTATSQATVAGGNGNIATGGNASIGGGSFNVASGILSMVPGGSSNTAGGSYSFAAGRRAKANHHGSFVWADTTDADFASTAANQFLVRASNVGIGTNSPTSKLDVRGGDISMELGNKLYLNTLGDFPWNIHLAGTPPGAHLVSTKAIVASVFDSPDQGLMVRNNNDSSLMEITGTGNAYIRGKVGIGTSSPASKLDISGILRLYDVPPPGAGIANAGYTFNTGSLPAGVYTELSGAVLDLAINAPQVGTRDTTVVGGIARLDTRDFSAGTAEGSKSFYIAGFPVGGSELGRFGVNLQSGEVLMAHNGGNVGIGTTTPAYKLEVSGPVMMEDATAPSALSGHSGVYSSGGELFALDAAGNTTQISPHDTETGEWIFYSKNIKTGRVVRVDMERLVKKIELLTGETFLMETWEDTK